MRVGLDVSPLVQTRAGTARHLRHIVDLADRRFVLGGQSRFATVVRDAAWYPLVLPLEARAVDVLHCPTFRGPVRSPVPLVVTVHDLAVLRHPETFNRWTRAYSRLLVPLVVRAARLVIAVSEFTRRELVELLGARAERVRVIPNAAEDVFRPDGPRAKGEYVLAVGTLEPRKNLMRLAAAAVRLGVEVRAVGAPGWGRVDARGVRWLGELSDDELAAQYRGALCLAYPSLYEGFGIPVLEAMACGTPVVTSAGGATEEVAGGAAVLVDPLDIAGIAAGIDEATRRRDELRRAGLARAAGFSWDAARAATAAVYREAGS
jgi:glycosyltransferase involved in cell wall biosynthesis